MERKCKKLILLLPGAIFPYSLVFALYCISTGFLMESVFCGDAFVLLFGILGLFVVAMICNVIFLAFSILRKWDANKISFANMLIKLIQIPAYVLIFISGIAFSLTLFTVAFSIFFVIFDCLAIGLTGLIGVSSVARCYAEGKTSKCFSIVNGFLQFVFCIDIVSAVMVFMKSKSEK